MMEHDRIEEVMETLRKAGVHNAQDMLAQLRQAGWSVAIHNDYNAADDDGQPWTFWLMTRPMHQNDDVAFAIKGEGRTDEGALVQCLVSAARVEMIVEQGRRMLGEGVGEVPESQ